MLIANARRGTNHPLLRPYRYGTIFTRRTTEISFDEFCRLNSVVAGTNRSPSGRMPPCSTRESARRWSISYSSRKSGFRWPPVAVDITSHSVVEEVGDFNEIAQQCATMRHRAPPAGPHARKAQGAKGAQGASVNRWGGHVRPDFDGFACARPSGGELTELEREREHHWRTGTAGRTRSTMCAAVFAMRRPAQLG